MFPFMGVFILLKETYVFIDAAYLSIISKHFGKGSYIPININQFAFLLAKAQGLWCTNVYYYVAPPFQSEPPTPEETIRRSKHDKFISKLREIPNFYVREGRCQKVDGDYHQKGVDTLLTMDLMDVYAGGRIKSIIVVTCDTDFVPILNKLRSVNIEVILYYFNDYVRGSRFSMSNHILTACDKYVLLDEDMFTAAIRKKEED